MSEVLEVTRVTHHYGSGAARSRVLDDVTVSLHTAAVLALVGRSGSGKSTLCHLMAGFTRPDEGSVLIDGQDAGAIDDWAKVSVCPQRIGLAEEFTVEENVLLPCSVRNLTPISGLLDILGLSEVARRPARDTSLGEQQRAGVARALVTAPRLAILDEPTGHQDDRNTERVVAAIALARQHGTAVVVATHDERLLASADHVVRLAGGRLVTR